MRVCFAPRREGSPQQRAGVGGDFPQYHLCFGSFGLIVFLWIFRLSVKKSLSLL